MQPQILVLKEGTENAQGKQQVISNINACQAIVDAIRTTLGPRGMDKLIVDNRGKATISNDGATIMKVIWRRKDPGLILKTKTKSITYTHN